MNSEDEDLKQTRTRPSTLASEGWVQVTLLGALLALLYGPVIARLVGQWSEDPNYSHGFFVPLFCAWVVWAQRDRLRNLPSEPSWFGLWILLGAMGILILGVLGAENFLSRVSLLFALAGLVIQFWGWKFFRAVSFPWAVLFLALPLPAIIFNEITLPLQLLASRLGTFLLTLTGLPVLREGNAIYLPSLSLDVAEACSGLRSLISLAAVGVFYGYFYEPKSGRRLLLFLGSVPVAIAANGFRIMVVGLLGEYWSPEKAEGLFHTLSGVLVFAVSLLLLMLLHTSFGWAHRLVRVWRAA
jgi:exosortase